MIDEYSFKSPIGILTLRQEDDFITDLYIKASNESEILVQERSKKTDLLYEGYSQILEYFTGKRREFNLPLRAKGTDFQRSVWGELRKIPFGETRSYQDIAIGIGNAKAVRAVGQANNKNPIIIIVPCHRVVGKNGSLVGFGCGIGVKKYLLDLENDNGK